MNRIWRSTIRPAPTTYGLRARTAVRTHLMTTLKPTWYLVKPIYSPPQQHAATAVCVPLDYSRIISYYCRVYPRLRGREGVVSPEKHAGSTKPQPFSDRVCDHDDSTQGHFARACVATRRGLPGARLKFHTQQWRGVGSLQSGPRSMSLANYGLKHCYCCC